MEQLKQEQPRKVLLVDDDRLVLATLGKGLEQSGYAVQACASVDEAKRVIALDAPISPCWMSACRGFQGSIWRRN